MKNSLKQSITNYFEEKHLSSKKMQQLLTMQEEAISMASSNFVSDKKDHQFKRGLKYFYGIAATSLIFIITMYAIYNESLPVSQRIATEVVHNHHKLKPLEIKSEKTSELNDYFTKLDFSLIDSTLITADNWKLLGGRYCSIQGITAAQLRVVDKNTDKLQTLYQAAYDPEIHGVLPNVNERETPLQRYANGVIVNLWVENGLLFALTGE
jgi:hypothetical protein